MEAYLARIDSAVAKGPTRKSLGCANFAHGFAACASGDKEALREGSGANLAIVTAYNDMLSAHQPYARFPDLIKEAARAAGGSAQVAGGDAVQVLVGEAVAVVAEAAGQGTLAEAFAVGGGGLADPGRVAEQAMAYDGSWD